MRSLRRPVLIAWFLCAAVSAAAIYEAGRVLSEDWSSGSLLHTAGDTLNALLPLLFAVPAALIISRLPWNIIGWLLMLPAVIEALSNGVTLYLIRFQTVPPPATFPILLMIWLTNVSWLAAIFPPLLVSLLFPTGRPPTPRWRWVGYLAGGMILFFLLFSMFVRNMQLSYVPWTLVNPIGFLSGESFDTILPPWVALLILLTISCFASIVVRYRRANAVERQQIKWLLYASTIFASFYVIFIVLATTRNPSQNNDIANLLLSLGAAAIAAAVMIAILRYHLFDIDVIIRLTLVYTIVTALLGLVYAGGVVLLQAAFRRLTGQISDLAVILTTLAIAALFNPLRGYVQAVVNRRFYRRKYNAEQALAEFASLARGSADVDALTGMLIELVEKTLQPAQVSVYLREEAKNRKGQ